MAREMPEEKDTQLLIWRDHMCRRRANYDITLKHSINAVSRPRLLCPARLVNLKSKSMSSTFLDSPRA